MYSDQSFRSQAKREQLNTFSRLLPESQGQNLVLTVWHVSLMLDNGWSRAILERLAQLLQPKNVRSEKNETCRSVFELQVLLLLKSIEQVVTIQNTSLKPDERLRPSLPRLD